MRVTCPESPRPIMEAPATFENASEPLLDADLMCIYRERSTGLKGCVLYVSPRNSSHGPRVKVLESTKVRGLAYDASISIEAEPRWLEGSVSPTLRGRVESWVAANRDLLLQFWNGEIEDDCVELAEKFVKV